MAQQWFHNWFNSPYYHLLYNKRDDKEAVYFINNLINRIKPNQNAVLLDVACGRGRHSVCLNKKGYDVTGFDLSIANIKYALQFENSSLQFFVHDMRSLFYADKFDIALNLFTSFGYFDTNDEHITALKNINKALKPGGLLVLDYFNTHKIINNLVAETTTWVNDIDFHITKSIQGNKIIKNITFEDNDEAYNFQEAVSTFYSADFEQFFNLSGFEVVHQFGNYSLDDFNNETADRLIFICKKAHV
jgi:SAM-dependent methyltransferase